MFQALSKKSILTLFLTLIICSACGKNATDEGNQTSKIPVKPTGMSDDQYAKTVAIVENAQKTIEATKDAFPLEAYLELGLYYQVLQDYDQSITALEKVLKEQPTNFNALNNIAVSYESKENKQKALEYYSKLADAYPDNWEAINDTLRLFKELKRASDGQAVLEHFVQNYPKEKDAEFNKFVSQMYEFLKEGK